MTIDLIDNRYAIIEPLGEGAMGLVWLVHDQLLDTRVALKVISSRRPRPGVSALRHPTTPSSAHPTTLASAHPTTSGREDYGGTTEGAIPEASLLQFKQEFRLMAQLKHPHCCAVHDFGVTDRGEPYFTMELVPGQGLDEMAPMDEATFRRIWPQLMQALDYLHGLGFVHGDLKSANVRVRPDGVVKLMDYGLMDHAGRSGAAIKGTVPYMAPEVIQRGPVDRRADLYAAGCLAYEMLTGRTIFDHTSPTAWLKGHLAERPKRPSVHRPGLAPDLDRLIMRLLEKEPLRRYQSALEVLTLADGSGSTRAGAAAPGAGPHPTGFAGHLLASPLIGRQAELATLSAHLALLEAGRPVGGLLLSGPAGSGKSRLLEQLKVAAQLAEVPCVQGAWLEHVTTPYGPIITLLKTFLPTFQQHTPEELTRCAPVLVKLLPELKGHGFFGDVAAAPDMDNPRNEQLRLQAAITGLLLALSAIRPFVVLLENHQWADPLSVDLMDYMLRNTTEARLWLVLTSREVPADGSRAVGRLPHLALAPLNACGIGQMVSAMLGSEEVNASFLEQVAALTAGNPFHVERLLEHLITEDVLVRVDWRWQTDVTLDPTTLPANLNALLVREVADLSTPARAIARLAAVVGDGIGLELLASLTGFAEDTLFTALGELAQRQLMIPDEEGSYTLVQQPMQDLLLGELLPEQRRFLHTQVARALETRSEDPLPLARLLAIAHHYIQGDDPAKTLIYALQAGVRSARLLAHVEAEWLLASGKKLLDDGHVVDDSPCMQQEYLRHLGNVKRLRLEYLRHLGDVKRMGGKAAEAHELLAEAASLAETLGEDAVLGPLLTSLAKACQVLQRYDEAVTHAERSKDICQRLGDRVGAARALLTSSRACFFTGRMAEALAKTEKALTLAQLGGDELQTGNARSFLGYLIVSTSPERLDEGVSNLHQAIEIMSALDDPIGLNTAYNLLGNAQNLLGCFAEARESFTQNQRLGFELGLADEEIFALLNLAIAEGELGRPAEALAWTARAKERATRLNSRYPLGMAMALEALNLTYMASEEAHARTLSVEALALAREIKNRYLEAEVLVARTEILTFLGRLSEAQEAANALTELIAETGNHEPEARLQALSGELFVRTGEFEAAAAAIARARSSPSMGINVRALKAASRLALAKEDWEGARGLADEGLVLSTRIGSQIQTAELRVIAGEVALALGRSEARDHFAALEILALSLDMPLYLALARFGLAGARPYDDGSERAAMAVRDLLALVAPMDASARAFFLTFPERQRVIHGNHIAFSLPRTTARPPGADQPNRRMGFGSSPLQ